MEEILKQIRHELDKMTEMIGNNNRWGFYDSTRYFESFIAKLLNIAYGWDLVNKNERFPNIQIIDLEDAVHKIHVQVTTQMTPIRRKLTNTIKRFNDDVELSRGKLYFFSLFGYDKSCFSCGLPQDRLLDKDSLLKHLSKIPIEKQEAALHLLLKVKDSQRISMIKDPHVNDAMELPITCMEAGTHTCFAYGKGRVRIDAYIPDSMQAQLCCLVTFAKHSVSEAFITLDEDNILRSLFVGYRAGQLNQRGFIAAALEERDYAVLQLGNTRVCTDFDTAHQLCDIVDALYIEYDKRRVVLLKMIGGEHFEIGKSPHLHAKILEISALLWAEMFRFANAHDVLKNEWGDENPWNRFIPFNSAPLKGKIQISGDARGKSIACILRWECKDESSYGTVCWEPGHFSGMSEKEALQNGKIWTISQAHDWLLEQLLPQVVRGYLATGRNSSRLSEKKIRTTLFDNMRSLKTSDMQPIYVKDLDGSQDDHFRGSKRFLQGKA